MKFEYMVFIVVTILSVAFVIFVYLDPIPATEEECQRLDGTHDHIAKYCDCKESWRGEPLNKSYTECHAKEAKR